MNKNVDHVARAAQEFCQIPRPSFRQKMQLQDLLMAYLEQISADAKKNICNILAGNTHVPKPLILMLCEQPAEICRALLLGAKQLNDDDLIAIITLAKSNEHARIIARLPKLSTKLKAQLRALNDERVDRALDLRQRPLEAHMHHESNSAEEKYAFENDDNEKLFAQLCAERIDAIIHTSIADKLGLQLTSAQLLCSDTTSKNLPTALRYLGLSEGTSWDFYRRLAGTKAYKDGVQDAFLAAYRSIEQAQACKLVSEWQLEELVALTKQSKAANDTDAMFDNMQKTG